MPRAGAPRPPRRLLRARRAVLRRRTAISSSCRAASSCSTATGRTSGGARRSDVADADVAHRHVLLPGRHRGERARARGRASRARVLRPRHAGHAVASQPRRDDHLYRPARPRRFRPRAQLHRRSGPRRLRGRARRDGASRRSTAMSIRTCTGRSSRPRASRRRPVLSRHLRGGPAGGAGDAVHRAGAAASGAALPDRRRAISAGLSLDATTSSSCATCRRPSTRPSSPRRA